jgi:acylphosphatase
MQSQITIHGSRVHEVGFRLNLLQYAKKLRFFNFEAFNDIKENEELVIIYVEGDEAKINLLIHDIQTNKPKLATVHNITVQPYTGHILPLATFSQDLQMEQMAKSVPILAEMRDLQKDTISMQKEMLGMQRETIGLQKETLGLQKETLGLQKETIGLQNVTIGLQKETLGLQKETLGLQKETLGLQKETLGLQKETIGLQNVTIGLQKETLALHKESITMHKESLKKQDDTIAEIHGLRDDFRSSVNDRLTKIEESLHTIKVALEQAKILG